MKTFLLFALFAIITAANSYSQCNHISRDKDIWGDFPTDQGKYLNDYNDSTGIMLNFKKEFNIVIDLGSNDIDSAYMQIQTKDYMHRNDPNAEYSSYSAVITVKTSSDDVHYDSLSKSYFTAYHWTAPKYLVSSGKYNLLTNLKRFLKLTIIREYNSSGSSGWTIDSMFIKQIVIFRDYTKFHIKKEGEIYKLGDTVKLVADVTPEFKNNYTIKWFGNTLDANGVMGDTLNVTSPGTYHYEYLSNTWNCMEYSDTVTVSKSVGILDDVQKDEIRVIGYYDYMGREIPDINNYSGLYFKHVTINHQDLFLKEVK